MNTFPGDPNWPTVTVVSHPGDLEPRLRDDAAIVGSAVFAAMRPDRLLVAWVAFLLLRLLGRLGELVGIGDRMLPADPVEAWTMLRETGRVIPESTGPGEGLLRGVFIVAGLFVVVLAAAMLVRTDAERLGRDRDVPLGAAFRWAMSSWRRLIGAVILPPVLALLLGVPAMLFGLLARVPVLDIVVAVLWIVPLVFSFAGAIVAVAWLWSLPLLVPASACEGGDPVEMTVRVAGLLRRRLPRTLVMLVVAVLAAVPGWAVVSGVVATTIALASGTLDDGAAAVEWWTLMPVAPGSEETGVAGHILGFWSAVMVSLAYAWGLGFVVLAAGRTYLVIRRAADRIPFEDLGEPGPG